MTRLTLVLCSLIMIGMCTVASAEGFYASGFGGVTFANDFEADTDHVDFLASPDTGYTAGVAFGTDVSIIPGARAEIEVSWRHSELGGLLTVCGNEDPLTGSTGTFAAMFNGIYQVDVGGFQPYVLAGAGYGVRRVVLEPTPQNWETTSSGAEDQGFVYQLGGGVEYPVADGVLIGIGYRYFMGPEVNKTVTYNGKDAFFESDGDEHAGIITLRAKL